MSENYKQRSILEIMNDVLGTIRDYYDSEYVYYIERDEEEILTIYEWCAEFVPWRWIRSRCLIKNSGRGGSDRISRIRQKQTTVFLSHWKMELRQFLRR